MARKHFIRHLEYYGFPDQNKYTSDINGVDLSDIREKNKEQDEEIKDLEDEKASKGELNQLSGTVDTLIKDQGKINKYFYRHIKGLETTLSALTDDIDEEIGDLDDRLTSLSSNTYTKEEVEALIISGTSGYATMEWVEEQGYIDQIFADETYAKKIDFEALSATVEDIETKCETLSGSVDALSAETDDIWEAIDALSGETDDIWETIDALSANTDALSEKTDALSAETDDIREVINAFSADTNEKFNQISENLDTKLDIGSFNSYSANNRSDLLTLNRRITILRGEKADRVELQPIIASAETLDNKINQEINDRTTSDTAINGRIDNVIIDVHTLSGKASDIEEALQEEINDRIQGDLDIIGNPSDLSTFNTIFGAKNYAKELANEAKSTAISSAKTYTDFIAQSLESGLTTALDEIRSDVSEKATVEYVDNSISALSSDVNSKLDDEINRALDAEEGLRNSINSMSGMTMGDIDDLRVVVDGHGTWLNAITEWSGDTPSEYTDEGNGVLDVLHKEFHEFTVSAETRFDLVNERIDNLMDCGYYDENP